MANKIFGVAEGILERRVEFSRSKPKNLNFGRGNVSRVVNRAPQVMVKMTSACKGGAQLKAHLDYITRVSDSKKPDVVAEDEHGNQWKGREEIKEIAEEWMEDTGRRNKKTRDSTNLVLSMPPGTNPNGLKKAVRGFAKETFGENHQYLFVLHVDEKHPHCHLTVKNRGYDGLRLNVKKGDPQKWREGFAKHLRQQGIEADATPRAPRGVVKKSVKQSILGMQNRRKKPIRPRTEEAKVKEALDELLGKKEAGQRPWEEKIKNRQQAVRAGWLTVAKELARSENPEDRKLSAEVFKFVQDMPPLKTERHLIQERLAKQMNQRQQTQQQNQKKDHDLKR